MRFQSLGYFFLLLYVSLSLIHFRTPALPFLVFFFLLSHRAREDIIPLYSRVAYLFIIPSPGFGQRGHSCTIIDQFSPPSDHVQSPIKPLVALVTPVTSPPLTLSPSRPLAPSPFPREREPVSGLGPAQTRSGRGPTRTFATPL